MRGHLTPPSNAVFKRASRFSSRSNKKNTFFKCWVFPPKSIKLRYRRLPELRNDATKH